MTILRKLLGIILMIVGIILALGSIMSVINTLAQAPKESGPEKAGYIFGVILFIALMSWLIYFLIKKGRQLMKDKPKNLIEEIGQS